MNGEPMKPSETLSKETNAEKDTAALYRIAFELEEIISREERRGLDTGGLENARREVSWAAGRNRGVKT